VLENCGGLDTAVCIWGDDEYGSHLLYALYEYYRL